MTDQEANALIPVTITLGDYRKLLRASEWLRKERERCSKLMRENAELSEKWRSAGRRATEAETAIAIAA